MVAVTLPHLKVHLQCCRPLTPRLSELGLPSHLWVLWAPPPLQGLVPFCRKPVNMAKATVNYRQEKTHMMTAVDRSFTDQSTLQEDERLGLSFMDAPGYSPRGKNWPSPPPGSQVTGHRTESCPGHYTSCVSALALKSREYMGCAGTGLGGAERNSARAAVKGMGTPSPLLFA